MEEMTSRYQGLEFLLSLEFKRESPPAPSSICFRCCVHSSIWVLLKYCSPEVGFA